MACWTSAGFIFKSFKVKFLLDTILFDSFIDNPTTYITTVGLYNPASELMAVAKLSRPLEKDFTKELLVRVKLDF